MTSDGDMKEDVKMPESGDVYNKINKLFREEEKETRKFWIWRAIANAERQNLTLASSRYRPDCHGRGGCH